MDSMIGFSLSSALILCLLVVTAASFPRSRLLPNKHVLSPSSPSSWFTATWTSRNRHAYQLHSSSPSTSGEGTESMVLTRPKPSSPSSDEIRSWVLLHPTYRIHTEVFQSPAETLGEVMRDIWRGLWISARVLEEERDRMQYCQTLVFPLLVAEPRTSASANTRSGASSRQQEVSNASTNLPETYLDTLNKFAYTTTEWMNMDENKTTDHLASVFQSNVRQDISFVWADNVMSSDPDDAQNGANKATSVPVLLAVIQSQRQKSVAVDFSAMRSNRVMKVDDSFVDQVNASVTIPQFPFNTVSAFEVEINRPIDEYTLSNLKFHYQVSDLRKRLIRALMEKKYDPEEFVMDINSKLTRLQYWKEILLKSQEEDLFQNHTNPFVDIKGWQDEVVTKFDRIKALAKERPYLAVRTQYDKKQVFLRLIDDWHKNLLRRFTMTYQTARSNHIQERRDLQLKEYRLRWKYELAKLFTFSADVVFLRRLKIYTAGTNVGAAASASGGSASRTASILPDSSLDQLLLSTNFNAVTCVSKMFTWLQQLNEVQRFAYQDPHLQSYLLPVEKIDQVALSSTMHGENVMYDMWTALTAWDQQGLRFSTSTPNRKVLSSFPPAAAKINSDKADIAPRDHDAEFHKFLNAVNEMARTASNEDRVSVKEWFSKLYTRNRHVMQWWSRILIEMDLEEEFCLRYFGDGENVGKFSCREVIDDILAPFYGKPPTAMSSSNPPLVPTPTAYLTRSAQQLLSSERDRPTMKDHANIWFNTFNGVVRQAEYMLASLPNPSNIDAEGVQLDPKLQKYLHLGSLLEQPELLHFRFQHEAKPSEQSPPKTLLMIFPKFYQNLGDFELTSFHHICNTFELQMNFFEQVSQSKHRIRLIVFHPLAVTESGAPDYARRSPYPAVLFVKEP